MPYINGKKVLGVVRTKYLNVDDVYPIGSIYMSVNGTSPASLFGGTWERLNNKFLYATNDDNSIGDTGGSATHSHSLGNAYAKMRNYQGNIINAIKDTENWDARWKLGVSSETEEERTTNAGVPLGGSTDSGDNMPPFIKVAIWIRTA